MQYEGRREAGLVLAGELRRLDLGSCIVAGIPRGGMVVAAAVAEHLGAALAALHTRKLFSPLTPELAFGAMDEDGHAILDYRAMVTCGLGESDREHIKAVAALEMERRAAFHSGSRLGDCVPGRTVVLVDDGLVTGLTMQAAIGYAQRHGATATVVAVPCGSDRAAYEMRSLLCRADDRLVCPVVDAGFRAVSDYYRAFPPVSDADVVQLLEQASSPLAQS
jgi:putative phosphoribosyl transferase